MNGEWIQRRKIGLGTKKDIIEEIVDKNRCRTVPSQIPIHLQQPDESFFLPIFCCFAVG
jgi:hypothetical protein